MRTATAAPRAILGALYLDTNACGEEKLPVLLAGLGYTPPAATLRVTLHRLVRLRLIRRRMKSGQRNLLLTKAGRSTVELPPPQTEAPPAPEGLHYFVTYDVPTKMDSERALFRTELRRQGWQRLHKSVWVVERDIRDTAIDAADRLGLKPYVFIGTGALLSPHKRRPSPTFEEQARRATGDVIRLAAHNLPGAFRRWLTLTRRLHQPFGTTHLSRELRHEWENATASLRRAMMGGPPA